jgi:hypothetical protein
MPDPRVEVAKQWAANFRGEPEAATMYAAQLILQAIKDAEKAIVAAIKEKG